MADRNDVKKVFIEEKIKVVLADRSKVNDIVDIIEELDGEDTSVVVECIEGLGKIFFKLIKSGTCPVRKVKRLKSTKKKSKVPDKPDEIFQSWLSQNYTLIINKLLELLQSSSREVMEKALSTLMVFLQVESQMLQESAREYTFQNGIFLKVVSKLTEGWSSNENIVKFMKPYLQYNDLCYYLLRNLSKIISKFTDGSSEFEEYDAHFPRNVFRLLHITTIPKCDEDLGSLFAISTDEIQAKKSVNNHNVMNLNSYKRVFTDAWMSFLHLSLESNLYRQVLVILEEKVIPNLVDPKILMDFLVDSYNIGGVTSILSLNSLFVLIHQYNLDYPDFYKKLYSLFNVEIFHLRYRGRFFYLADLFLMSTHLPAYLVAAFIKRLSRLALRAPPYGVALVITFVGNLIRRHPNCKVLIHRKQEKNVEMNGEDLTGPDEELPDPFREDEEDPSRCQALQSSLWELETLRQHYYPEIKSLVELLEKPLGKNERDISEYCNSSYESLFDEECKEFTKSNAFIEYHMPKGLLSDSMNELWSIDE